MEEFKKLLEDKNKILAIDKKIEPLVAERNKFREEASKYDDRESIFYKESVKNADDKQKEINGLMEEADSAKKELENKLKQLKEEKISKLENRKAKLEEQYQMGEKAKNERIAELKNKIQPLKAIKQSLNESIKRTQSSLKGKINKETRQMLQGNLNYDNTRLESIENQLSEYEDELKALQIKNPAEEFLSIEAQIRKIQGINYDNLDQLAVEQKDISEKNKATDNLKHKEDKANDLDNEEQEQEQKQENENNENTKKVQNKEDDKEPVNSEPVVVDEPNKKTTTTTRSSNKVTNSIIDVPEDEIKPVIDPSEEDKEDDKEPEVLEPVVVDEPNKKTTTTTRSSNKVTNSIIDVPEDEIKPVIDSVPENSTTPIIATPEKDKSNDLLDITLGDNEKNDKSDNSLDMSFGDEDSRKQLINQDARGKLKRIEMTISEYGFPSYLLQYENGQEVQGIRGKDTRVNIREYKSKIKEMSKSNKYRLDKETAKKIDPYLISLLNDNDAFELIEKIEDGKEKDLDFEVSYDMENIKELPLRYRRNFRKIARGAEESGLEVENFKDVWYRRVAKKLKGAPSRLLKGKDKVKNLGPATKRKIIKAYMRTDMFIGEKAEAIGSKVKKTYKTKRYNRYENKIAKDDMKKEKLTAKQERIEERIEKRRKSLEEKFGNNFYQDHQEVYNNAKRSHDEKMQEEMKNRSQETNASNDNIEVVK